MAMIGMNDYQDIAKAAINKQEFDHNMSQQTNQVRIDDDSLCTKEQDLQQPTYNYNKININEGMQIDSIHEYKLTSGEPFRQTAGITGIITQDLLLLTDFIPFAEIIAIITKGDSNFAATDSFSYN